jgi:hypothetical protein
MPTHLSPTTLPVWEIEHAGHVLASAECHEGAIFDAVAAGLEGNFPAQLRSVLVIIALERDE